MTKFQSFVLLLSISGLFSYINHHFIKLPSTIGMTMLAILMALPLGLLEVFDPLVFHQTCQLITTLDFKTLLLDVMLSLLLFAGALNLQIKDLSMERTSIITFSTLGVLISTALVGCLIYGLTNLIGYPIPLGYAFAFGALISPTDPIAALAILKELGVQKSLESTIAGESLFNDGVGVVVFLSILNIVHSGADEFSLTEVISLFLEEAGGGILVGLLLGFAGFYLLKSVSDEPKIDIMLTLVVAMGGYALCSLLHVSGPLAMVVAALIIGDRLRKSASFTVEGKKELRLFWEVLDEIMNAILFVLIGLEILILSYEHQYAIVGAAAILIVLASRLISVFGLYKLFPDKHDPAPNKTIRILTWGGLRGGISVALALSLEPSPYREYIIFITYVVVVFSILVQGLTIKKVAQKLDLV